MSSVLVSGGAGFIGSNFIHYLLEHDKDCKVVNLDKLTYSGNLENLKDLENNPRYQFAHGSINDEKLVSRLMSENNIRTVVNFAAESHVDRSIDEPKPFFETNVMGTLQLLQTSYSYWKSLDSNEAKRFKFIHISTDEVFGSLNLEDPPFDEETPYAPNSPYAASKAASDHLVGAFVHTYQFPAIITNCSNNYGPYQFPEKVIPLAISCALESKPIPIYGDGSNIRDWLYVEDHCEALCLVMKEGRVGSKYAIGGCCEVTNLQLIDSLCDVLGELAPNEKVGSYKSLKTFVQDRPGHDFRYSICIDNIKSELNWSPKHDIRSGLKKTVKWYLDNSKWCESICEKKYQGQRLGLK